MTDQIHLVVATPCFGGQVSSIYAGSIFHLQRAVRSKSNIDLKVLMRDGDALITRARANLVTLFLDDPVGDALLVRGCRYRLYARPGIPADRIRRRHGGRRLSDQAGQLGQGEADAGGEPAENAVGRARLRARDRRSRSCRRRQRLYPRALRRNRLPDDQAPRPRKDVPASGLRAAAVLPRAFARCARRKPEPVCVVRVHDRSEERDLSQRGFRLLQALDRYRRRNLG